MDSMQFMKKFIDMKNIDTSVIINKINNVKNFKESYYDKISDELGLNVAGIIPNSSDLSSTTVEYLIEILMAKVVAGEGGLTNKVKNVFVGSASANAALRNPLFESPQKLIITSGDRSDMILAALETDTSCIVLTNNTLPPANILNKATDKNVPLLLVPNDTFRAAKLIDDMVPLLLASDSEKIDVLKTLIKQHVDIQCILD
ncbi:MAG: DRTGG domain-containing protein [Candidatus Hodarchaeales archaeon]